MKDSAFLVEKREIPGVFQVGKRVGVRFFIGLDVQKDGARHHAHALLGTRRPVVCQSPGVSGT